MIQRMLYNSILKNLKFRDEIRKEIILMIHYEEPKLEIILMQNEEVIVSSPITNDPNNLGTEWWG